MLVPAVASAEAGPTCAPPKRSPIKVFACSWVTASIDPRVGSGAFASAPEWRDLLLKQQQAVQQRLRRRRTSRDVHVHWNDPVHTLDDVIAVPEGTAGVGARSHRHRPLRVRHLGVNAL